MEELYDLLTAEQYFTKELEDLENLLKQDQYQEKVFKVLKRNKKFDGTFEDFKERFLKKKIQGSGLDKVRENLLRLREEKKEQATQENTESEQEDGFSVSPTQSSVTTPKKFGWQTEDSVTLSDRDTTPYIDDLTQKNIHEVTAYDPTETFQISTGYLPQPNQSLEEMEEEAALGNVARFDNSLKLLNEKLINKAEENAVPYLRSMFEEYGYDFEQATIFADAMKVYGPTNASGDREMVRIDLQPFGGLSAREKELQKLKDFFEQTATENVKRNREISDQSRLAFREKEFSKQKIQFMEDLGKFENEIEQLQLELLKISKMDAAEKNRNEDKIEALNLKKQQLLEQEKTFQENEVELMNTAESLKQERREVYREEDTGVERVFGKWFLTDFLGDMQRAWYKGQARGATVDEAMALMDLTGGEPPTDEQIQDFIIANERMKQYGESDEMIAFTDAYEKYGGGVGGFIMGFLHAPTVLPEVLTSSIGAMATEAPLTAGLAAFSGVVAAGTTIGATGGAITGSAVGGVGAIPGAAAGAVGGFVASLPVALRTAIGSMSTILESGLTYAELLQEELGENATDPEAIRALLEDEDKNQKFKNKALARGVAIGVIDALTFGVTQAFTGAIRKAGYTKLTAAAGGATVESLGGALGETLGMTMAGQEYDAKEIMFEATAGLGSAPVSVGLGLYYAPTYKLNGQLTSLKEMNAFINTATDKQIAETNIEIKNDKELLGIAKEKRSAAIDRYYIEKDIDPDIKGEARERLIQLEVERAKLVNKKTKSAENKLKAIEQEIDEISEGNYKPKTKTDIEAFFDDKEKREGGSDTPLGQIGEVIEEKKDDAISKGVRRKDETGVEELEDVEFTPIEESISLEEAPLSENQKQDILNETGSIDDNDSITVQSVDETGKAVVQVSRTDNATGTVRTTQVSVQLSPDQKITEKVEVEAQPDEAPAQEAVISKGKDTVKSKDGVLEVVNEKYADNKVTIKGDQVGDNVYLTSDPEVAAAGAKSKTTVTTKVKQKLIKRAIKVAKALKRVAPNVNIILAQNTAEFQKVSGRSKAGIMGTYNTKTNDIYINLDTATPGTIAHEAFHALLRNGVIKVKSISASLQPTVQSIKKILQEDARLSKDPNKHQALLDKIDKYLKNYGEEVKNEEFVAEIIAEFSKNYTTLPVPARNKIIEFIQAVAKKLGLGKVLTVDLLTATDKQIGQSLNSIISSLTEGKDVKKADVQGVVQETPAAPSKKVSSINPITKKKVDNDKVVEGDLDRMGEAPAVEDGVQVEFYHNTDPNKKTLQQKIEGSFTPEEGTKTPYSDSYGYKNKKYTGNAPDNFLFITPKAKAGYDMLGPKYKVRAKFNKPYFVDRNKVWTQEEVNDLIADGYDVIITGKEVKGDIKNISEAKDVIPLDKSKVEIVSEVTVREKTPADTQVIEKDEGPVSEVRTVDTDVDTDMDRTQLDMFEEAPKEPTKKPSTPKPTPPKKKSINKVLGMIRMSGRKFIDKNSTSKAALEKLVEGTGYKVFVARNGNYYLRNKKTGKIYTQGQPETDLDRTTTPDKDNISKMLPKEREAKLKQYIKDARDNNFTDKEISEYLIKVKKFSKKEVDALIKKGEKGLIPDSFTNLKKDKNSAKGIRLYKRVAKYAMALMERNKTRKKPLTQSQMMDRVIKFLEEQPEYKAEADSYTASGKAKKRKGLSEQQAKMQTEIQSVLGQQPTVDMRQQLSETRNTLRNFVRGRRTLSQVKTQLRNFMRQTLPKDVYTKPEVMKLIRKIDLVTKETLPGIMNEVVEFAAKKNVESLKVKIRNKINGKYSIIQSGKKKAYKVDADTQEQMEKIKEYSVKDNATTEERTAQNEKLLKEYKKLSEKAQLTEEDMNSMVALEIAMELNNVGLMDNSNPNKAQSLLNVNSQLDELIFGGKERLQEEVRAKHEEYKRNTEIAYKEITGEDIDLDTEEGREKLKKQVTIEDGKRQARAKQPKIVRALRTLLDYTTNFFTTGMDIATLMNKISVTPGEMFGGKLQELVTDKIDDATREFKARKMLTQQLIRDKLKELYGPKWKKKARKMKNVFSSNIYFDVDAVNAAREEYNKNKNSKTKANLKKVIEENTIPDVTNTTQNKLYYLYNQFKDPANHPAFENMWGPDYKKVAAEIEAALDPETKKFADWQVDELFPMLYEYYNKKYREIYRTNLPWNENYAGRIYRKGITYDPLDLLGNENVLQTSVGAASAKVRVNTTAKIDGYDGTDALLTYLNDMEWFSAMASPLKDVNKMLLNPEISSLIKNIYGETTFKMIKHQINKVAAKGIRSGVGAKEVNLMTDVFIVSKLGLNPTVMLKQLTSFVTYSNDIGPLNWIKHAPKTPGQVLKTWNEIRENSVYMKDRKYNSINKVIESYSETGMESIVPVSTKDFIVNFLMWTTKFGDRAAIYLGGMSNYNYYKAEFKKKNPNATEQQAIDYAVKKFERDTKRTQQSTDLHDKDYFQTSDPLYRPFNMFLTTPKQYLRKEIQAITNMYRKILSGGKKGKGTWMQNLRTFALYHGVMPVFFQYVAMGLPGLLRDKREGDEEDLIRAAVIGNLNGLFIMGDVLLGIADGIQGKPWAEDASRGLPIFEKVAEWNRVSNQINTIKGYKDYGKPNAKGREYQERIDLLLKKKYFILVEASGLPATQVSRFFENYKEIFEGDVPPNEVILRLFNYSDYVIKGRKEKETPKKKLKLTKEELKKYNPREYHRQKQEELRKKNSPAYQQEQQRKRIEKQRRQEKLRRLYNR